MKSLFLMCVLFVRCIECMWLVLLCSLVLSMWFLVCCMLSVLVWWCSNCVYRLVLRWKVCMILVRGELLRLRFVCMK